MPISKKRSIQDESLFLQEACVWSICVKNGCADHSACMDEDQNSDISYGQLDHSVGILQSDVVEAEQDLEQLQVNYHIGIRHSEIWWDWCSLEYERTHPCHIQDQFGAWCGQALPKVWWWAWEVQVKLLHLHVNQLELYLLSSDESPSQYSEQKQV